MAKRIVLRNWRVSKAEPSGLFVWYDPDREVVELYELDPETESRVADALEGVDPKEGQLPLSIVSGHPSGLDDLPF